MPLANTARTAWLASLGLLTYLLVNLAGVTDKDLLLNSPVALPIVNVRIPLFSFFLAAPFLLVLVHLSLLLQHVMLAHKYQHFSAALAERENGPGCDHPDRRLVHGYVFSQLLAGAEAPWLLQMLMRLMIFITLSLLPVLVLLFFQIKFLPFHGVAITHAHRFAILLDLVLLLVVRPFIAMPSRRPVRAFSDGSKTYIEFPKTLGTDEAPPLFLNDQDGTGQLVNYRVKQNYYIVDRLFDRAELRLDSTVVAINTIGSSGWSRWFEGGETSSPGNRRGCRLCRDSDDHGDNDQNHHDASDHHGMS